MKTVRLGIIGLGGMGTAHARQVASGKIQRATLAAVCDRRPERTAAFPEARSFSDSDELLSSGAVNAVLIATPHFAHTTIGVAALSRGLHVLVEKPISVHKADAERLIAAHQNKRQVFAAMFNMRTRPSFRKIRDLIRNGELGTVRRVQWTATQWFRTDTYYKAGGWRASWKGEGGGLLVNQCPHQLDLLQWLFGMPVRIRAFCRLGAYHDIEVEDEVTAYLEYDYGATGLFLASSGEAPGIERLEIAGDQGLLTLEGHNPDHLLFKRNEQPADAFCKTSPEPFAIPPAWNVRIPLPAPTDSPHALIISNFVDAILDGTPLIAPGKEGIRSVELANAMLYSTFAGTTVDLPLDAAAYAAALEKRIRASKFNPSDDNGKIVDFNKSFR